MTSAAPNILLLAGSTEARQIAARLQAQGHSLRALVSEPPRGPNPMPVPCRLHPFDNAETLAAQLDGVTAVIDASHGFDPAMTDIGAAAARIAQVPFLSYSRPAWDASAHPTWQAVRDMRAAMPLIAPGSRVFAATGWQSLAACADFPGAALLLRQTVRHDRAPPYPFVDLVFGMPPFTAESEQALFERLSVDLLICRNLGGTASRPKLDAALALDLPVLLIDRPPRPQGVATVDRVEAVLDWVATL